MKNKNHVITRTNRAECGAVCQNDWLSAGHIWQTRSHVYGEGKCQTETQSDVVIPNKLGNSNTCQGLLRCFVHQNTDNNEFSPHNDMIIKTITNLLPYFPISLPLNKKVDSSLNALALNGYGFAFHPLFVRLRMTAFTLAEVLITLGIIGVVVAMTIPTLMTKIQSTKLKSEYKEAYATIAQAVKMYNSDDDRISFQENGYKSFMKYFTGATDCGNTDEVADDSEYCFVRQSNVDDSAGTITNKDSQYKNYSKKSLFITTHYLDDGQFYLQKNNMLIAFDNNPYDSPNPYISVDINGKKNKPNAWGHDVFTFELVPNEKEGGYELLPQGAIGTTLEQARNRLCNKNEGNTNNGVTCSYFAQNNPTYFDNLPK